MACFYDSTGKIVFTLTGSDETITKNKELQEKAGYKFWPESLVESEYFFINDKPTKKPPRPDENNFFDYSLKKWVLNVDYLICKVKNQRNLMLEMSDWTDTVSAQSRLSNYQQWQDYRQELRDIPQQSGYPENVIWPDQPQ